MRSSKLKAPPWLKKREHLETLKKEYAAGSEERKALYGDKNPDDEEQRLNKAVSDAESAEKQARDLHNELQQKWNTAKTHVESLKKRIDQREPELKKMETEFSIALEPAGFSNEEQFLEARLSIEQRDELAERQRNWMITKQTSRPDKRIGKRAWPRK